MRITADRKGGVRDTFSVRRVWTKYMRVPAETRQSLRVSFFIEIPVTLLFSVVDEAFTVDIRRCDAAGLEWLVQQQRNHVYGV